MTAAVDKLADDLVTDWDAGFDEDARDRFRADLRTFARAAAAIGWDEGHRHCFHVDPPQATSNPYTTEEPS